MRQQRQQPQQRAVQSNQALQGRMNQQQRVQNPQILARAYRWQQNMIQRPTMQQQRPYPTQIANQLQMTPRQLQPRLMAAPLNQSAQSRVGQRYAMQQRTQQQPQPQQ